MFKISNEISKCCALCEHSMRLDFKSQYICKYKNSIAEVKPDDCCRHFEFDLLKVEPKPKKKYTFDI